MPRAGAPRLPWGFAALQALGVLTAGTATGCECAPTCETPPPHVHLEVDGRTIPRCAGSDWPAALVPPAPDPEIPESLPAPFDDPDRGTEPVGGFVFGLGAHSRTLWGAKEGTIYSTEEEPARVRAGYSSATDGVVDVYCVVDSHLHDCLWSDTGESAGWRQFTEYAPVRAWELTIVDPPRGGFDWTVVVAEAGLDTHTGRVSVYHEEISAHPRFDLAMYERAAAVSWISNTPIGTGPMARSVDGTALETSLAARQHEACTIPIEVSVFADGRQFELASGSATGQVLRFDLQLGEHDIPLRIEGAGDLPTGTPIVFLRTFFPGLPRIGVLASGEYCLSGAPGVGWATAVNRLVP